MARRNSNAIKGARPARRGAVARRDKQREQQRASELNLKDLAREIGAKAK